jgi:3-deoxy-manno-octulosonate cytidylyltransferase (CMP-KDO synthetase)
MIDGKPMVQWVYERTLKARCFSQVIVATDDLRIEQAVSNFGGTVLQTRSDHPSGTDRVWEVAQHFPEAAYIFNVQGDEPFINSQALQHLVALFLHQRSLGHAIDIVTLCCPLHQQSDKQDPHCVKVVKQADGKALYFSRAPIPYARDAQDDEPIESYRHLGLYGYTRDALERFVTLPASTLETLEKLEQLRALEAGFWIHVETISEAPIAVDTPEDLERLLSTHQEHPC